jgi:DNA-binding transcriptional LysR family regulator
VAAGMGFCIMPEYLPRLPGVITRPMTEPDIIRHVSLVTMAGRRFSPAVASFVKAIKGHPWSNSPAASQL